MVDLKAQKPAKRYTQAIFDIVKNKDYNLAFNQISSILNELESRDEFRTFMFHPIVSNNDKKEVLFEIFKNYDVDVLNFVCLLIDENRLDCLDEIKEVLEIKINEKDNIKMAQVTLAQDVGDEVKNIIKSRIENKLQSKIQLDFKYDKNIIGGMIVRIKDTLIDLSIKNKIENIKNI